MAAIKFGFSTMQKFEAVPAGEYELMIFDTEFSPAQSEDKPHSVKVQFKVKGGKYDGRSITRYYQISEKALVFFHDMVLAAGYSSEALARDMDFDGPNDPKLKKFLNELKGRTFHARVTVREYEGQERNEVRPLSPAMAARAKSSNAGGLSFE